MLQTYVFVFSIKYMNKYEFIKKNGYSYDPITGNITSRFGNVLVGGRNGYIDIQCKGIRVLAHQYAWYVVYGENIDMIDHINRNRKDNRIVNLRRANSSINQQNKKCKGYSYHKRIKKWSVNISLNYKKIHIGYFLTEVEAENAYLEAKKKYHLYHLRS